MALFVAACGEDGEQAVPEFDRFHGWSKITAQATGRFRTERVDGTWWLITPEGHAFFSAGINNVSSAPDYAPDLGRAPYHDNILARYGSDQAWADVVVARFADLGFTTIGAWSDTELFAGRLPYCLILGFEGRAPRVENVPNGITGRAMRDYFSPQFVADAPTEADAGRTCGADPFCIGVFTDNELGWDVGVAQAMPFVDGYITLPAGAPGKRALQDLFEDRYGDVAAFNRVWSTQIATFAAVQSLTALPSESTPERDADRQVFAGRIAHRYAEVVHDSLRAADPNVLILGPRLLAYSAPAQVVAAIAPYVDVLSANYYEIAPDWLALAGKTAGPAGYVFTGSVFGDLDALYAIAGKPMLVSEFGYRAADVGLPNTFPPLFPVFATQTARAAAYEGYMRQVLARPYLVGAHWFEHADQPREGRFDGEDNNWGVVDIHDDVYPEISAVMRRINYDLYSMRTPRS